jgi:hypothetical protein
MFGYIARRSIEFRYWGSRSQRSRGSLSLLLPVLDPEDQCLPGMA